MAETKERVKHINLRNSAPGNEYKSRWWTEPEKEQYRHIQAVVNGIYQQQAYRKVLNLRHARLYSNTEMMGLLTRNYAPAATSMINPSRLALNIVKSCIDTVSSKIAQSSPRPYILTTDGDDKQQRRGKLLQQFIDGVFDVAGVYQVGPRCFTDSCIFGTGFMKIYTEDDMVKVERVRSAEIVVDDAEGADEKPRQLHQQRYVDRAVVMALFPKMADKIAMARDDHRNLMPTSAADQVLVTESWHLPSGPDTDDGMHVLSISNCTLSNTPWTKDYFPFALLRWSPAILGFFGDGLAFELTGIQLEVNKLIRTIQVAQHKIAGPRILVQKGSSLNEADLGNAIGGVIFYNGAKPEFETSPAMPGEVYQHLENLIQKAYQISGISQLSATSQKPDGDLSGVALRSLQDIQTERFALCNLRYEQFFIDAAKIIIDMAKDLYEQNQVNITINVPDARNRFVRKIKWSDVNMADDAFMMRIYPTALLPATPAGKLESVQEMFQAGLFDKNQAMLLLDYPDLESVTSLANAAYTDIRRILDNIIEDGKYEPPEPFMDLNLAISLAHSTYLQAKDNKVPEDRLELIRVFVEDCQTLLQPGQPPAQPAAPQGQPIAAPQPPPQSQLVPYASAGQPTQ